MIKRVFQSKTGNALVSPVSVYTLLAILQQGAGGTTRQEVTNVVHAEPDVTKESYRTLTTHYKVCTRQDMNMLKDFHQNKCLKYFVSKIHF